MEQNKKINISREIIIEKSNFISNNSTYFKRNFRDSLALLKGILLNHAPLTQCEGYQELISEIKKTKVRNITEFNYQNSMEILFNIVHSILQNTFASEDNKKEQIETIRQYVKCVSTQVSGKIYYHSQNIISVDNNQLNKIENEIKQEKNNKRYMYKK